MEQFDLHSLSKKVQNAICSVETTSVNNVWVWEDRYRFSIKKRTFEDSDNKYLAIDNIWIHKDDRGKGLCKSILEELYKFSPYEFIAVENVVNERFYKFLIREGYSGDFTFDLFKLLKR